MSNVILLKAYEPEKNPEMVVRPVQDQTGQTYTGQGKGGYFEDLSDEDKRNMGYVVTPGTSVKLTHGLLFHLDRVRDKANWEWISKHPYISSEKLDNRPNDVAFYVHHAAKTAKLNVSKEKRRVEVMNNIYNLPEEDQRKVAAAIGLGDTTSLSIDEVLDYIQNTVSSDANRVEALIKDKSGTEATVILKKAVNASIVVKTRGWYKFEDVNLGNGEAQAIAYLKSPENEDVVLAIKASLEERG